MCCVSVYVAVLKSSTDTCTGKGLGACRALPALPIPSKTKVMKPLHDGVASFLPLSSILWKVDAGLVML